MAHIKLDRRSFKMKVELTNYTENALELLILTKSGRLGGKETLQDILAWPWEKKMEHLSYMMNTIKTSFEFVDYVFEIREVTRAFTHQLVRTRTASFQQQAMRVVDAREAGYLITCDDDMYKEAADHCFEIYGKLVDKGYPVQDCRGILPTAAYTSIFVKANLRTLSQMAELRLCKRAEGEYQQVFKVMVDLITKIHPWTQPLLEVYCVKTGICAFPLYEKCPIQKYCISPNILDSIRTKVKEVWNVTNHVANPVAKDGRTM